MTKQRRLAVLSIALMGPPILCALLGLFGRAYLKHGPDADGADLSRIWPYFGLGLGCIGSVVGLAVAMIVGSIVTQQAKRRKLVLYSYMVPVSIAFVYMTYILVHTGLIF